jgi:hypothetical protein
MNYVQDLSFSIVPRSDQMNAEQLLAGPMTITVTDVRIGSEDQPVVVHYQGDDGRPFKPCKTMRKLMIFAWGADGSQWVGRSLTVFNDPSVRFGGLDVGGIRISHMSHIKQTIKVQLTATKGRKAPHEVKPLQVAPAAPAVDHQAAMRAATTQEALKKAFAAAYRAAATPAQKDAAKATYDGLLLALMNPGHQQPAPPPPPPPGDDVSTSDNADFLSDLDAAEGGAK